MGIGIEGGRGKLMGLRTEEARDSDHEVGRDALILVSGRSGSERCHGIARKNVEDGESKRIMPGGEERRCGVTGSAGDATEVRVLGAVQWMGLSVTTGGK